MCHNVTSDRFFLVRCIRACRSIGVRHDLVRDNNCDTKLRDYTLVSVLLKMERNYTHFIREALKRSQKLTKMVLARSKFTTPAEVGAIKSRARINNEQTEPSSWEKYLIRQFAQIICITYRDSDMSALALVNRAF
jgi:hypothetical protein